MERPAQILRKPGEKVTGQLLRYGIVAGSGYLLAIGFYAGELSVGVPPYAGLGVAFVVNGIYNFTLIRLWAFPSSGRSMRSDLGRFCIVAAASFVVNYASFAVLFSVLGLTAGTAQRLAILIAAPITFIANRLWSFRKTRLGSEAQADGAAVAASARKESYSRM